jgi:hypothetical protein
MGFNSGLKGLKRVTVVCSGVEEDVEGETEIIDVVS